MATVCGRLRAVFRDRVEYAVLCPAQSAAVDRVTTAAAGAGIPLVRTRASYIALALVELWRDRPHWGTLLLFPANGPVVNACYADAVLGEHLAGEMDLTIAADVPIGLAPVAISASGASWLARVAPHAVTFEQLLTAIASSTVEAASATGIRIARKTKPDDVALEHLPATALVTDEPTRLAAEAALTTQPTPDGWDLAYTFKRSVIHVVDEPRSRRGHAATHEAAHIVVFSSLPQGFSGGEASLATLIAGLDRREFYPITVSPFETMLTQRVARHGLPVEIVGRDYSTLHPANLRYCADLIDEYRPSLIHVDGWTNPALMVSAYARGIPIVGHLRSMVGPLLPSTAHLADRIITVSDAVARDVRRSTIDPRKIVPIHNGVDRRQLDLESADRIALRHARQIPADALVIAMIATIAPNKRIDLMVEALPAIVRAVPAAHLVLVGEPFLFELTYQDALRAKIEAAGLSAHITWWGFEQQIGRIYALADLLVHTNRHEPLARCMLESLACGLPIVGPRDGGTVEVIEDGENGLLYEPDSPESLAAAVITVVTNPELRQLMGRAALARSAAFSVQRHVDQVQALYQTLLRHDV
jgi:glycosyltransferase involved in cell wall biosynthesis